MTENESFRALYDTIVKLRSPGGCDWDMKQTPQSLRGALIEETFECLEAIDKNDPAHIAEELGDLYLLVTMIGYIHEQEGKFSVCDVLKAVNEKLIRRHPHVFNNKKVKNVDEILENWEQIKIKQEGREPKESIMDEVSSTLPPMERAFKLQKKAAKTGFDWNDRKGVEEKIKEELQEVSEAVENNFQNTEEELGDLLFSVINLCRFLSIEPSAALNRTNYKFIERFKFMEKKMKETGQKMSKENIPVMDKYWDEAKLRDNY